MVWAQPPHFVWGTQWVFYCATCGDMYFSFERAERCEDWHNKQRKEEERLCRVKRNIKLLVQLLPEGRAPMLHMTRKMRWRVKATIYRLYRELNLTPKCISSRLLQHKIVMREGVIKDIIGCFFRRLCLSRDSCILKPYLTPVIKND